MRLVAAPSTASGAASLYRWPDRNGIRGLPQITDGAFVEWKKPWSDWALSVFQTGLP